LNNQDYITSFSFSVAVMSDDEYDYDYEDDYMWVEDGLDIAVS